MDSQDKNYIYNHMVRKHLSNKKPYNWLDYIEEGKKKYEGRINDGFWKNLRIDDKFILFNENKEICVRVVDKKIFRNFGDAFDTLGMELIPLKGITRDEVINLYGKYYDKNTIDKYGVVAIKLNVFNCF
jgi:ASC-1-like (ASCH) protein